MLHAGPANIELLLNRDVLNLPQQGQNLIKDSALPKLIRDQTEIFISMISQPRDQCGRSIMLLRYSTLVHIGYITASVLFLVIVYRLPVIQPRSIRLALPMETDFLHIAGDLHLAVLY